MQVNPLVFHRMAANSRHIRYDQVCPNKTSGKHLTTGSSRKSLSKTGGLISKKSHLPAHNHFHQQEALKLQFALLLFYQVKKTIEHEHFNPNEEFKDFITVKQPQVLSLHN